MRILLLLAMTLLGAAPIHASSGDEAGVRRAFLFAFPIYKIAQTRAAALARVPAVGVDGFNHFVHRPVLSDASSRAVTTPNNDTLYSSAWIDVSDGPVVLDMPALPDRYHSVALMSPFSDNFAVLGTRNQHGRGGRFLLTGPGWKGKVPAGMARIAMPADDAWALLRVLVDGPADLPAAASAQARFSLAPLAPGQTTRAWRIPTPPQPSGAELLDVANAALARGAMPADRARIAASLRSFGITPGQAGTWNHLAPDVQRTWTLLLPRLMTELRGGFAAVGTTRAGWSYPRPGMGEFGNDEFYRAAVALGGLAALPAVEAVYLTAVGDSAGVPLLGSSSYRLTLPRDVPVGGFWSLSMYEIAPDGRLFFTPNALDRFAIGNRTAGMNRNPDGSLYLLIQNGDPGPGKRANWLPAPPGPFRLTFRAYLPRPEFFARPFRLAPLTRRGEGSATNQIP